MPSDRSGTKITPAPPRDPFPAMPAGQPATHDYTHMPDGRTCGQPATSPPVGTTTPQGTAGKLP